jgi:RimK family alpha-L-glutamate ligase
MNIAVLSSPSSWYLRDLQRAAGTRHQVTACSFSEIAATVGDETEPPVMLNGNPSTDFDALLVRTMPPGSLEQVIFRMNALARVTKAGTLVLNPPRALEVAIDKYLTLVHLADAGLSVPRTATCQTKEKAMEAFARLGGDVVIKPLFGGEGRGIARISDPDLAHRAFQLLDQLEAVIYLQEYIPHAGFDVRVFAIGDELLAMRRENRHDWRSNISRGACAIPMTLDTRHQEIARQAIRVIGAPLAGVDILEGPDGRLYVLEVNAVPGWRALARVAGVDVASMVFAWLEREVAAGTRGSGEREFA